MLARTGTTLLAAAAALAISATPASAEGFDFGLAANDFFLRISANNDGHGRRAAVRPAALPAYGHRRGHRRGHRAAPIRGHMVEGYYVDEQVRTWVEGRQESVYVPATYRTEQFYDACGNLQIHQVLVSAAHYETVWRPGYWATETVRRWVPGHWVEH